MADNTQLPLCFFFLMIQQILPRDSDCLGYVSTSLTLQKAGICTINMSEFLIWVTALLSWMPPLSFLMMSENIKLLFGDSLIKLQQWKGILNYLQNQHVLALTARCFGWPTDRLTSCVWSVLAEGHQLFTSLQYLLILLQFLKTPLLHFFTLNYCATAHLRCPYDDFGAQQWVTLKSLIWN